MIIIFSDYSHTIFFLIFPSSLSIVSTQRQQHKHEHSVWLMVTAWREEIFWYISAYMVLRVRINTTMSASFYQSQWHGITKIYPLLLTLIQLKTNWFFTFFLHLRLLFTLNAEKRMRRKKSSMNNNDDDEISFLLQSSLQFLCSAFCLLEHCSKCIKIEHYIRIDTIIVIYYFPFCIVLHPFWSSDSEA